MAASELENILDGFRDSASDTLGKGRQFERLIADFLRTDPQYAQRLQSVWPWEEWPHNWGQDTGIDLVAQERDSGDYWAIQCKFYNFTSTVQKPDIDSFLSASGKKFHTPEGERQFTRRLVISTTNNWGRHAETAIDGQTIPVTRLGWDTLENSPVDWASFRLAAPGKLPLKAKKQLRHHQKEAVTAVLKGFRNADRGQMIMACGTGKTLTSLRIAERLVPEGGNILFFAPSISLIAQTLREWTTDAANPMRAFVVCSDTKVGRDKEDIRLHDLAYPATTDPHKLARELHAANRDRRTVIFSTYQSSAVIAEAQRQGIPEFDLVICDEAHRTTGLAAAEEEQSAFLSVHDNAIIRARKRLYMTATPRVYTEASKSKAGERQKTLHSMDDAATFGDRFYDLSFGEAITQGLLSDYKAIIVAVEEGRIGGIVNRYNRCFSLTDKKAITVDFAAKIMGSWKGLSKTDLVSVSDQGRQQPFTEDAEPMRRAVAFSRTIKNSQRTVEVFERMAEMYDRDSKQRHAALHSTAQHSTAQHSTGG